MAGTLDVFQMVVVGAAMVSVGNAKPDGRAGGLALEYARQKFDAVVFVSLRRDGRLPGLAAVEFGLHECRIDVDAGGAAVDDATDGCAVRFAKGRQAKNMSECVAHGV